MSPVPFRSLENQDETALLRDIQQALSGLRFGAIEITVHNGQVVQIERKEKFRPQTGQANKH
ncbi:sulfur starvation response protein OscA [Pseudomonas oryzihabitans]|uniref:sulfur starvation response protein OscA n=1 Tax=Pseudomonas oryzihabitans TaxID=47885 RepID=UPI00289553A9|nr:sulfur starvation response protein OscA [Pseudomonas oryzihabitans]MDT3718991.1 sulfur starvation response protein OscA [Pseudomonas oryzihabitans]